jgi:hypothetical protein
MSQTILRNDLAELDFATLTSSAWSCAEWHTPQMYWEELGPKETLPSTIRRAAGGSRQRET